MKRYILFAVLCLVAAISAAAQSNPPTLFRSPSISRTDIVFSYGGDLWIVPRSGGDARPLTSGIGEETNPYFSPDGTMVAFTGDYDGNTDVYVVPAAGGVPKRLTYHPAVDIVSGWTPDSKNILFSSTQRELCGLFASIYDPGCRRRAANADAAADGRSRLALA